MKEAKKLKLSFTKKTLGQLDNSEMYSINGGDDPSCTINNTGCATQATCPGVCDHDTPTINDDCQVNTFNMFCVTTVPCNTFTICDSHDWCGYEHETNCNGPLLTVGSGK